MNEKTKKRIPNKKSSQECDFSVDHFFDAF